jgi:Fibronectin type III domain
MHRRTWCLTLSILLCVIGLISSYAQAGQVQLSWDAPTTNTDGSPITDLAGYKVYYSQAGGNFSSVDVGKVTTYTLSGLQDGKTYFFVTTAYDTTGQESGFSNDVSTTLPLPVSINSFTVTPTSMVMGTSATLAWTTTGATSVSITPDGSANLTVNGSLTVSPSATTTYTLTATGTSGTVTKQVTVTITVTPPQPTVTSFTATPTSITGGKSAVLAWTTSNATVVKAAESVKLWLEGEEAQESGLMQVASDEEASAGQYVWVPEGNGTMLDPAVNDNFVRYTFTVPKADTYIIWGHVSPSATGTGSFFMAMDDAAVESGDPEPGTIKADQPPAKAEYLVWTVPSQDASDDVIEDPESGRITNWVWDQAASDTTPIFFLEAGEHTLIIKQRESGTKLDQLLITNDLEYRP